MRMQNRAGFTLVELMVAMALTLFIMVILSQAFVLSLETFSGMKGLGDMQINLRTATSILRDDLSQDHFEGKRRLSDLNAAGQATIVTQPIQAGFFAVLQQSAVGAAGYVNEGTDTNGLISYRANNHFLYMTVKRRGNRQENFFTATMTDNSARQASLNRFFGTKPVALMNSAYDVAPLDLSNNTLTQSWPPPPPMPQNIGYYSSQWAEVAYFLSPQVGSTEEPNNPTSTLGTPLYELYRVEWVMVPDGTNVSAAKLNAGLATTTFQGLSCGANGATLAFYSPMDAAGYNAANNPVVKRVYPFLSQLVPNAGRAAFTLNPTPVLPSVISFQIQVMQTSTTAASPTSITNSGNNRFGDPLATKLPPGAGVAQAHLYDTSLLGYAPYTNQSGLMAIQITLRVWDNKTRQTRQITIVQDL